MAVIMSKQMVIPSTLPPIGTPLNDCTWEQISEISNLGLASSYFSVGDTKTIIINGTVGLTTFTNLSIDTFIIGIDHNAEIEGTNKIHFQIGKINGKAIALCDGSYNNATSTSGKFTMNTSGSNSGGWKSSHMRKTVLGSDSDPLNPTTNTLLASLPSELRTIMKPITKYTDNTANKSNTASNVTATTDYLPLLAEFESYGTRQYANSAEQNYQKQYAYYSSGNSRIAYNHTSMTTAVWWWLRSASYSNNGNFHRINTDGGASWGDAGASYSAGIRPIFAV